MPDIPLPRLPVEPKNVPDTRPWLTVLVADVSDRSALFAQLGDQKAKAAIARCLSQVTRVPPRFGGRIVRATGDALMCVFSEPGSAALAAGRMQAQAADPDDPRLGLHIGIHHGPVTADGIDLFGDTVNAASYLTAVADVGEIVASQGVVDAMAPAMRSLAGPLSRVVLKGTPGETTIYRIQWSEADALVTHPRPLAPVRVDPDPGALLLEWGGNIRVVDAARPVVRIGRAPGNDLVIDRPNVSREHALVVLRRLRFHVIDRSVNGSWLVAGDGAISELLRSEAALPGAGLLWVGSRPGSETGHCVRLRMDRRSAFRPRAAEPSPVRAVREVTLR
jgi:adenylate cyclase